MLTLFNAETSIVAILLATVTSIVIGMLWYGPLFGKMWMQLVDKKREELEAKPTDYLFNIVSALLTSIVLSMLFAYTATSSAFHSLAQAFSETESASILSGEWSIWMIAILVPVFSWIAFSLPVSINRMVWEGGRRKLIALNAAHQFVTLVFMSIVIALVLNFS